MFGWFKKPQPKPVVTEEDLGRDLKGYVMASLSQNGGLTPRYREDVMSEEDFEARAAELPLVVFWGERDTPQGLAISMSINKRLVSEAVLQFVAREDLWFHPAFTQVVDDLRTTSFNSMMSVAQATGTPPSVICKAISQGS
jgi:hypothetical protein